MLVLNERVIRYAQDDFGYYGLRVRAFEVLKLSDSQYEETEIEQWSVLQPAGHGWNGGGMHHIDLHELDNGSWLASVDGWRTAIQLGVNY